MTSGADTPRIVLFEVDDNEFPMEIIDHNGERWIPSQQVARALGIKNIRDLVANLRENGELIENKHFCRITLRKPGRGNPTVLILSYRGVIRVSMRSEGRRAKEFRDWSEDVLYEVMITGYYSAYKDTNYIYPKYNLNSLNHMADDDKALEMMLRKRTKMLEIFGIDRSKAVFQAAESIRQDTGIDVTERLKIRTATPAHHFDVSEKDTSPVSDTKDSEQIQKKDTRIVSDFHVPKIYRGWSLTRRGKNKSGEVIFNLVKKIGNKRIQKYLGTWNRKKADLIIDEMNRKYNEDN